MVKIFSGVERSLKNCKNGKNNSKIATRIVVFAIVSNCAEYYPMMYVCMLCSTK
jgi:hypothetical protein